jgi:hypothetical protein
MESTKSELQKKYIRMLNSYNRKIKKLNVFDINFLLQDLIDKDQVSFCGNNGKLKKDKYDISLINLTDPKKYNDILKDNKDFHFRISFRLKNDRDVYTGDQVINRLKKYI